MQLGIACIYYSIKYTYIYIICHIPRRAYSENLNYSDAAFTRLTCARISRELDLDGPRFNVCRLKNGSMQIEILEIEISLIIITYQTETGYANSNTITII